MNRATTPERRLLEELVFLRLLHSVDMCALLELEAELRHTADDLGAGPAGAELVNQVLEHSWRRLERHWRGLPDEGDGGAYRVVDDPARRPDHRGRPLRLPRHPAPAGPPARARLSDRPRRNHPSPALAAAAGSPGSSPRADRNVRTALSSVASARAVVATVSAARASMFRETGDDSTSTTVNLTDALQPPLAAAPMLDA